MARHSGHRVAMSTVLRILDDEGLLLKADYQRERRHLPQAKEGRVRRITDRAEHGVVAVVLRGPDP